MTDRAAWTKSGPYAEDFTASFILSDSSDLHKEAMYSTEPRDAFNNSLSLFPDCTKKKKKMQCQITAHTSFPLRVQQKNHHPADSDDNHKGATEVSKYMKATQIV